MNKIYKITWNHSRGKYMVTHEHTRSHRKGRLCAALVGAFLGASALMGAPSASAASDIKAGIIADVANLMEIKHNNGRYDITTGRTVHGHVGVNHFYKFQLGQGDLANFHLQQAQTKLVNYVDTHIQIDGVVNSLINNQVGGDLFFVSPLGMTVGTTGVINAGSLTAIAADHQYYTTMLTSGGAYLTDATLSRWQSGDVPLSRNATITVKGSINAGNAVTLAAADIKVEKGARISTKVDNFKDLVNIKDAQGTVVLSSGIENGQLHGKVDAAGDVVLFAVGDTKYFELDENNNPTGAAKFYEHAKAEIKVDGVIESRGNIKVQTLAGSGTYDANKTLTDGTHFITDSTNVHAKVESTATINGQLLADKAVTVEAKAENVFDNSGATGKIHTAEAALDWVLNNQAGLSVDAAYGNLTTNATVDIGKDAVVEAKKGPLTVTSSATSKLTIGASTDAISVFNKVHDAPDWYAQGIPTASAAVAFIDNAATVNIEGALKTGSHLTIGSTADMTAEVTADVGTIDLSGPEAALVVGLFESNAKTNIDAASITISADPTALSAVNLYAKNTNSIATTASASIQDGSYAGVVMNYTEMHSDASVLLNTPITNEAATIAINAVNLTTKLNVKADTAIGPFAFVKRLEQTKKSLTTEFVAGLMGKAASGIDTEMTPEKFRLGGVVGVFIGSQNAGVTINAKPVDASTPSLHARGDVTINSTSTLYDHQFYANSRVVTKNNAESKGQASLALFVSSAQGLVEQEASDLLTTDALPTVSSSLDLLNDTSIVATNGNVNLFSEASVLWNRMEVMKAQMQGVIGILKNIWEKQTPEDKILYGELWAQLQATAKACEDKFKAVGTTETLLGDLTLLQDALNSLSGVVNQFITTLITPVAGTATTLPKLLGVAMSFLSPTSYVNTWVASGGQGHEGAFEAAGAIALLNQFTKSELTIGKNVKLSADGKDSPETEKDGQTIPAVLRGRININGRTQNESVTLVGHLNKIAMFAMPNIQEASAAGAGLAMQTLDTVNIVRIREGADLQASNHININAEDMMSVVTIAGAADVTAGTLGLDILAAASLLYGNNLIEIDDEVFMDADNIHLQAHRDDDMQTIAGSLLVSHGDDATLTAGASIAINHGETNNAIRIRDNDRLAEGETSLLDAPGIWHADGSIDVSADADVAINAVSVAGTISASSTGEAMQRFTRWIMPKVGKPLMAIAGVGRSMRSLEDAIVHKAYSAGETINQTIKFNQEQNHIDNSAFNQPNDPGQADLSQQGQNGATTAGNNQTTPDATSVKIEAAGTLSLNDVDIENVVDVDVASMTIDTSKLNAQAVVDKWIGTLAGTGAITYMSSYSNSAMSSKFAAGLAGAVALNLSDVRSGVNIKASDQLLIKNQGDRSNVSATEVDILAVNDGTILTEGLTASVVQSGSNTVEGDINVSVNMSSNTTEAVVDGIKVAETTDESNNTYRQTAWSGETQVTGGTGFGLATTTLIGQSANAMGFIVAVADIENTVTSVLKNADISAKSIDVRALASLVQVTTAINAQIAATSSTFALSGTAASSLLTNHVYAEVADSTIMLTDSDAHVQIVSRDANDEEHNVLDATTEKVFAFDQVDYTYTDANGQTQTGNAKANDAMYKDVGLYTDTDNTTQNVHDFLDGANMVQSTTVISLGVTGDPEKKGVSIGAGVLVNDIDNEFTTSSKNLTIDQKDGSVNTALTQTAESNVVSVGVTVGAAGSAGAFSAAGSVIVSDIDQKAQSLVDNVSSTTQETTIAAGNEAVSVNVAGNVGVSVGQESAAVGAAVVVANTNNHADVAIKDLTIDHDYTTQKASLQVTAQNQAESWVAAADVGVSGSAVVGGTVVVNRVTNDSTIAIDGLVLDDVSQTAILADDRTRIVSLGGNVAVSGYAGVAGAVLYTASFGETSVDVKDVTVTHDSEREEARNEVVVEASGEDHVIAFATAVGVSTEGVGFGGVASTNDISRHVSASLGNVSSSDDALRAVGVLARENADIDNGSIVASASSTASIGIGIAIDRIDNTTAARLYDNRATKSVFTVDRLEVSAVTDNDIDTVGVGGGGSGTAALSGSIAVNLIDSDTTATVDGTHAELVVGLVEARSDDTIGNYGGQAVGSGTAAEGMTVTVSEKTGTTSASVQNAVLTEVAGSDTLTTKGAVADSTIKDGFVKDLSSVQTLADDRESKTIDGLAINATSTENFKTFLINGSGSGVQSFVGTNNVVYHGGETLLNVTDSTISTVNGLETLAGDYVAVDTVMTSVTGSQVAIAETVNVTTTDHATRATLSGNTISGDVDHRAEAKEGISHFILSATGSYYASVSPAVNVNRFLSDVSTTVVGTEVVGGDYLQKTTYLGYANGGSGLVNGAAFAAVGANVNVNYFGNDVTNNVTTSTITSDHRQDIEAQREVDVEMVDVTVSGAIGAASGYVNVNTIEGLTQTNVTHSTLKGHADTTIAASNLDRIELVGTTLTGGVGAGGTNVVVNSVYGDAKVSLEDSTTSVQNLTVVAEQDRDLTAVSVLGSGGVGALQANVVVNNVGNDTDAFATDVTGLGDTEALVEEYLAEYASATTPTDAGLLKTINETAGTYLTDDEQASILASAATNAALTKTAAGTTVSVTASELKAVGDMVIKAQEDMGSDADINVSVGSGTLAGLVLDASVATLRYQHAAHVDIAASKLSSGTTTVAAYLGGDKKVGVYQGAGALIGGTAAYSDVVVSGGGSVEVTNSDIDSSDRTLVEFKDTSNIQADAFGVSVGGIFGGGVVGHLVDDTQSGVHFTGKFANGLSGHTTIRSLRDGERSADVIAGYGASFAGIGALAKVYDHGSHSVLVQKTQIDASTLNVEANNQMVLKTEAGGHGGGGAAIGVVEARTHATGKTAVTVADNTIKADSIRWVASSGRQTSDDEALQMKADAAAYSGTVCGNVVVNLAEIENKTASEMLASNNAFSKYTANKQQRLDIDAFGYAIYDADAHVAGGSGTLYSGNTQVNLTHGVEVSNTVAGGTSGLDVDVLDVTATNKELATGDVSSYGGAFLVIEGSGDKVNAVDLYHTDSSNTTVNLSGDLTAKDSMTIASSSHFDITVDVDNTKGAVGGGSGAALQNEMIGNTRVVVDENSRLTSGGDMSIDARTDLALGGKDNLTVKSAVYGAITGTGININNSISRTTAVEVSANTQLTAADRLQLSAFTKSDVDLRVKANSAGILEGVRARADHDISISNEIDIGEGAKLVNHNSDELVVLSAAGDETYYVESVGDVQGAVVAGAEGYANMAYRRINSINIAQDADVEGAGHIWLLSGQDVTGKNARLKMTVLAQSYGHALISGVEAKYTNHLKTVDTIDVAGDVLASQSITAYADQGDLATLEEARLYKLIDEWGDVQMASTAAGTASENMVETSRLTVTGSMKAGTKTKFDVTVSGIVDPTGNQLVGAQTTPTVTDHGSNVGLNDRGKVDYEVKEIDLANQYWERHEYLLEQMSAYAPDSANPDQGIYLALKAEDDYLVSRMVSEGYATITTVDGKERVQFVGQAGKKQLVIEFKDIQVSGGDIYITSGAVKGNGTIAAQNADGIRIDNQSNMGLVLEDIVVSDSGGRLTFNDVEVKSIEGFTGTLKSNKAGTPPYYEINSKWSGGTIHRLDSSEAFTPDSSILLTGKIANHAGDMTIFSGNDIRSTANVSAAGALKMTAEGSIVQTYASGITNIGGSVSDLWKDKADELWNSNDGTMTESSSTEVRHGAGSMIAGGDIIIAGDIVNINGLVQSGYADYGLLLTDKDVQTKIDAIHAHWQANGKSQSVNPRTDEYLISAGGFVKSGDTYIYKVAAWYDPVNRRIIIDDIDPRGGHVYITGAIANTGGGRIVAGDGHATVHVEVGNYDLQTGNISTGNLAGVVRLTDTSFADSTYTARVTEFKRDTTTGNMTKSSYLLDKDGREINKTVTSDAKYTPKDGLLYLWAKGKGNMTTTTSTTSQDFTVWGLFDIHDPSLKWTDHSESSDVSELDKAETVATTQTRPSGHGDDQFYAQKILINTTEGDTVEKTWTTYKNWTHFGGTHHAEKVTTTCEAFQYLYTVKADNPIDVTFANGDDSITLKSGRDVFLGGNLRAEGGTVNVTAGHNIFSLYDNTSIAMAQNVSLTATHGQIGEKNRAIRLSGTGDLAQLTALAQTAIYLDASQWQLNDQIEGSIVAGADVVFNSGSTLWLNKLTGSDMTVNVSRGSVVASGVEQLSKADGSQQLAITADGSVLLKANTDLAIGQIISTGDVSLETTGSLIDALPRDDENGMSVQEKEQHWIDIGILNEDGSAKTSRYEDDLAKVTDAVKAQWQRYEWYQANAIATTAYELTDTQVAEYEKLKVQFAGYGDVDAYITAQTNTEGTVLNHITANKDRYHAWNKTELLYAVADSIVNPDASSGSQAKTTNIRANGVISLKAGNLVGEEQAGQTFDLTTKFVDESGELTSAGKAFYQTIARANADDVTWDVENKQVTIELKNPLTIDFRGDSGYQYVNAEGSSVYLQSLSDQRIRFASIKATDTVRLTAGAGIVGTNDNLIQGKYVTLQGGLGSIGTAETKVRVWAHEWMSLSAQNDIYVMQNSGDMVIASLSTDGKAVLQAADSNASILSASVSGAPAGVIRATDLILAAGGSIGKADEALRLRDVETVRLTKDVDGLYLNIEGQKTTTLSSAMPSIKTTVSGVGIQSQGSIKVDAEIAAAQAVTINATGNVAIEGVSVTGESHSLTVQSTAGDILVNGDQRVADTGGGDIRLLTDGEHGVTIADQTTLSAKSGHIDIDGQMTIGSQDTFIALGIDLDAQGDVKTDRTTFTVGAEGLAINVSEGSLNLQDVVVTSEGSIELKAEDELILDQSAIQSSGQGQASLTAYGATTLSGSSIAADRLQLSATGLSATADGNVSLADAKFSTMSDAMNVTSTEGSIDLSGSRNKASAESITAGSIVLDAQKDITLSDASMKATAGSITMSGIDGTIKALDEQGEIAALNFSATQDVSLQGQTLLIGSGDSSMQATGDVTLEFVDSIEAPGLDVKARSFEATSSAGSIDLSHSTLDVSKTLSVHARRAVDLSDSSVPTTLSGALSYVAEEGNVDLRRTNSSTDDGASGTNKLRADSIEVVAGSEVMLDGGQLDWTATGAGSEETSGQLTLKSDNLDIADDSSLNADAALLVDAENSMAIGNNVTVTGATVDIESGELTIGSDNTLSATNGDLNVIASGDATLGGQFNVDAKRLDGQEAQVTIGADGLMKVEGNDLTIHSNSGAVTVFGGEGMSILDDLTIISQTDSTIKTDRGDMTIGNGATIKAGTVSGLANNQYGRIEIVAGENFAIGDEATILADKLSVTAGKDVTFGDKATLHGVTDGVTVTSVAGDITMGEHLEVVSNAANTEFKATQGNIHIKQDGTLISENSLIEFAAGSDVIFDANFTADGQGFTLSAGEDVEVGDGAQITTHFDQGTNLSVNNGWPVTVITAARDITFGQNASFDTTMMLMTAGSEALVGHVRFGDNSRIETSRLGIGVIAYGDVAFGKNATFGTLDATARGNINLLAMNDLTVGDGTTIKSTDHIHLMTQNGAVDIGRNARIVDLNDNRQAEIIVSSETKDVTIGAGSELRGRNIEIVAAGGSVGGTVTLGHDVKLLAIASGQIDVEADQDIVIEQDLQVLGPDVSFYTHEGDIRFGANATLVSTGDVDVDRVTLRAGRDIDMSNSARLFAKTDVNMSAQRHVTMGTDSWIYSDATLSIKALNGNIDMAQGARLGAMVADTGRGTTLIDLSAGGDIRQVADNVNKGIVAQTLKAKASNSVILGAVNTASQRLARRVLSLGGGNRVENVEIDAGENIVLALSDCQSNVLINSANAGRVNGHLIVHGQNADVTIDNDVDVRDETSLHAKKLSLENVTSGALLELSTNHYDTDRVDGIVAKSLKAPRLVILTEEGSIRIDHAETTSDLMSIARSGTRSDATVQIGSLDSAYSAVIYNGKGAVAVDRAHAADTLFVVSGEKASIPADSNLQSDMDRVAKIENASHMSNYLTTSYLDNRDASMIVAGFVPYLDLSYEQMNEPEELKPIDDIIDEVDEYNGSGLRYDADARALLGQSGYVINNYWLAQFDEEGKYVVHFRFDSSVLNQDSRTMLNELVARLVGVKLDRVTVSGYADRLGAAFYNQRLSEKRAQVVKTYLVANGIPSRKVYVKAEGTADAIVECADGSEVIRCLAPNRRSEIEVEESFLQ